MDGGIPEEEIRELEEYRLVCTLTISNDGNTVLNIYGEELNYVIKDSCLINPGTEEKKLRIEDGVYEFVERRNDCLIPDLTSMSSIMD